MRKSSNLANGFTLIELSVVLIIIGLMVGGILVGRDLVRTAEVRAQISQIQTLETQITTFKGKYDCLPGDCEKAVTLFGNVFFNGVTIANGDGDGMIRATSAATSTGDCGSPNAGEEIIQLFSHLGIAQMGAFPNPYDTTLSFTPAFPPTVLDNGFTGIFVNCINNGFTPYFRDGNYIFVGGARSQYAGGRISYRLGFSFPNAGVGISLNVADNIDKKIDDGLPQSGAFGFFGQSYASSPVSCFSQSTYLPYPSGTCKIVVLKRLGI